MVSFRRTAVWVLATNFAIYLLLTVAGVLFMSGHHNELAKSILSDHRGAIASIYGRILLGYMLAGLLMAFLLHPFLKGWKAAPGSLLILLVVVLHMLTSETQLIYGPVQTLYSKIHDAIPEFIRNLYQPVILEVLLGVFLLWSLHRWTSRVPLGAKAVVIVIAAGAWFAPSLIAKADRQAADMTDGHGPNFVLIATDSLRADHLHCNGYPRETSPHIDALAARGTNFSNNLVPTASTHESWIALFSSTEPRVNGLRHMFPSREKVAEVQDKLTFLPKLLTDEGYATAAIGGWCGTTFKLFDVGFAHVDVSDTQNHLALIAEAALTNHLPAAAFMNNPVGRWILPELGRVSFARSATALTSKAKKWISDASRDAGKPFFLTVVYHVTHLPYSSTYPYYTKFTNPDYRGDNRYRINFKIDEMITRGFDHDVTAADKQHIIDLYDGCVLEFDAQVGALVAHLKKLGILDNTIVGVWGDHGDDLYEHGTTLGHGVTLFGGDHANKPPAVFAGPHVSVRHVGKLTRSIDLAPTWMSWLGLSAPDAWQGADLTGDVPDISVLLETSYLLYRQPVPDLQEGEVPQEFPKFDNATFLDPEFDHNFVLRDKFTGDLIRTKCFAVREGDWKLIYVPGESGPIYRLFDLAKDPQCKRDLRAVHVDTFQALKRKLPEHAR